MAFLRKSGNINNQYSGKNTRLTDVWVAAKLVRQGRSNAIVRSPAVGGVVAMVRVFFHPYILTTITTTF
jgi:hypothetical protein